MKREHYRSGPHDVALAFATRVGVVLLALLSQAMLARLLLPEGRGSYAVCLVYATTLGMLFTPGAQQGAQQFVMTREMTPAQAVSCAMAICLLGSGLAVALSLPLIGSGFVYFQKAGTSSFHVALAMLPFMAFALVVEHQLAALRRFGRLAAASALRMLVNVVAIGVLVWLCGFGVSGGLWAVICADAAMIAACLWDLRRHCGLEFVTPSWSHLRRILGYGLRYHVARAAEGLSPHIGVFLLGMLASDAEIGLFAAASALMVGFLLVSNSVGNALLPRIASSGRAAPTSAVGRPELVATCMRLVLLVTAAALVAVLAAGEPLVRLFFSDAFLSSLPLLWLIAPGMLAHACAGVFATYFKAVNRPGVCSWAQLVGLSAQITSLVLLYQWFGIAAAAAAITIGAACRCAFLAFVFRKATGQNWVRTWVPQREDFRLSIDAARSLVPRLGRLRKA